MGVPRRTVLGVGLMHIETIPEVPNVLVVENFFTEEEQASIWAEINYLAPKLKTPDQTFSAENVDGTLKKSNRGLFVNSIYTDPVKYSSIIQTISKVYTEEFIEALIDKAIMYRYLYSSNRASTLLNEYGVGDFYNSHTDDFVVSIMAYFIDESIPHEGGDLVFSDYNYTKKVSHNNLILMPSYLKHEVTPVVSENPNFKRYSIVQFVSIL